MSPGKSIMLIAGLALAAPAAEASQHTFTFTITNNTATPWLEVIFEIRPPIGVPFDPDQYALVRFMGDPAMHDASRRPVRIYIAEPENKALHFDYSEYGMLTREDGPVQFTMTIDNPPGMDFRVGWRKVLVPAPAASFLALLSGTALLRRRRRAA